MKDQAPLGAQCLHFAPMGLETFLAYIIYKHYVPSGTSQECFRKAKARLSNCSTALSFDREYGLPGRSDHLAVTGSTAAVLGRLVVRMAVRLHRHFIGFVVGAAGRAVLAAARAFHTTAHLNHSHAIFSER